MAQINTERKFASIHLRLHEFRNIRLDGGKDPSSPKTETAFLCSPQYRRPNSESTQE